MTRTHKQLLQAVVRLAHEAGDSGCPYLENALLLIVRAASLPLATKAMLVMIGMGALAVAECKLKETA